MTPLHSRQSAHRLTAYVCDRLNLSGILDPDAYYGMVDYIQRFGALSAFQLWRDWPFDE